MERDGVKVELIHQEVIGMLRLDVPATELLARKVTQVGGDDHLGVRTDRGSDDVPIALVRKGHCIDQWFVAVHSDIANRDVHQFTSASQPGRVQVGTVRCEVVEYFVQDSFRPSGLHQPAPGDSDQDVAQETGLQHVGVVDDDERHQMKLISCPSRVSSAAASRRR